MAGCNRRHGRDLYGGSRNHHYECRSSPDRWESFGERGRIHLDIDLVSRLQRCRSSADGMVIQLLWTETVAYSFRCGIYTFVIGLWFSAESSIFDSLPRDPRRRDRKSTRLNSSHLGISYA